MCVVWLAATKRGVLGGQIITCVILTDFFGVIPINLLLSYQKCQGVHFSPICQIQYFCKTPLVLTPFVRNQAHHVHVAAQCDGTSNRRQRRLLRAAPRSPPPQSGHRARTETRRSEVGAWSAVFSGVWRETIPNILLKPMQKWYH